MADSVESLLARNWWAVALRGVLAIIIGLIALFLPGVTVASFVLLFAVYMLVDGVFTIIAGFRAAHRHQRSWPLFLEGVADIVAGLIALFWPVITLLVLIYLAAFWGIVTGVLLIAAAFHPRAQREWLLALGGIVSVVWGILILFWPIAGALVLAIWFGAYALVFGILLLIGAFSLRRRRSAQSEPAARGV